MIKPVKLYLIRHAPVKEVKGYFPDHNPDAIIKNNQLKMLATLIPNNCVWYVSPLKRTLQTAKALYKYVSYSKMIKEDRLAEQKFGDWSGKKISEIWKKLANKYSLPLITFGIPALIKMKFESERN